MELSKRVIIEIDAGDGVGATAAPAAPNAEDPGRSLHKNSQKPEAAAVPGIVKRDAPDNKAVEKTTAVPDEELMAAFQASDDEEAFSELVRRYSEKAFRVAVAVLGNREEAEDAVQECFLRVVRARASYRSEASFSVWLFTLLRNVCRNELRRRSRVPKKEESLFATPEAAADPSEAAELREEAAAARAAFEGLPAADREILTLRIHGGLAFSEIAAACGLSTEATKKRAYRALERLRHRPAYSRPEAEAFGEDARR